MMNCDNFKNQFGEIRTLSEDLQRLILSYNESENSTFVEEFGSKLEETNAKRQALFAEYEDKVFELLSSWRSKDTRAGFVLTNIEVEDSGRVTIGGDRPFITIVESKLITYFPRIIQKVRGGLNIQSSGITSADYLEEVTGDLNLGKDPGSFNSLVNIGGQMDIKFDGDFRSFFPKLKYVGSTPANNPSDPPTSFLLKQASRMLGQIMEEKEAGRLFFDGEVKEWWL